MPRLRSAPRVKGTMQNVQCMLHPCMMETKAVACRGAERVIADRLLRAGSSPVSTMENRGIVHGAAPAARARISST